MGIEPARFRPGDRVLTIVLPGLEAEVEIVDVLSIRGQRFYVVVIRDEPDLVPGLRPEGTVRPVA